MTNRGLSLVVGVCLLIAGFSDPGLLPWQLPACMLGGYLVSVSLIKNNNERRN